MRNHQARATFRIMVTTDNGSPIQYPHATIGGVDYEFRFSFAAIQRMVALGVPFSKEEIDAHMAAGKSLEVFYKNVAAVAGNYEGKKWRPISIDWDQIPEVILPNEFGAVSAAITEARSKVIPAAVTAPTQPGTGTEPMAIVQ
jgi:hypothetical protein